MKLFLLTLAAFSVLICASNNFDIGSKRKLKVLVYSAEYGYSHIQFQGRLADILVEAGHEVHLLYQFFTNTITDYTGCEHCHKVWRKTTTQPANHDDVPFFNRPFDGNWKYIFNHPVPEYEKVLANLTFQLVNDHKLINDLTAEKFDVAIAETYNPGVFGFFHKINVYTKISSLAIPLCNSYTRVFGFPIFSSYMPNMFTTPLNGAKMTFLERFVNFYNVNYDHYVIRNQLDNTQEQIFRDAFGPDSPSLHEITRNISLIFVNTNPLFALPQSISQKVVFIGGISRHTQINPLDHDVLQILENSKRGVVLFSLGTLVDTKKMSATMRDTFLEAFSRLPDYDFIWRFEAKPGDEFSIPKNVHLFKWFDQKSILHHPNLKVFITHCGLNGINEAAFAGIPMIGIPLFGDQYYNAATLKEHQIAEVFEITQAETKNVVYNALIKVLTDPKYTQNVQLLKKKLSLTPFSAKENFLKWFEFAAEFANLNEFNLPLESELGGVLAYYNLDVMLFSVLILVVLSAVLIFGLRILLTRLCCWTAARQKLE